MTLKHISDNLVNAEYLICVPVVFFALLMLEFSLGFSSLDSLLVVFIGQSCLLSLLLPGLDSGWRRGG